MAVEFAKALSKKAEEGLQDRVVLDNYGASFMSDELSRLMKNHGVVLKWFRPLVRWKIWKTDNRTHRKVLICDKKVAFTGGVGIAKEWEGNAEDSSEWRETHFKILGEGVSGLQAAFMENWIETNGFLPIDPVWEDDHIDHPENYGNSLIQCLRTSASVRWSDIIMLYQTLIRIAQENILKSSQILSNNRFKLPFYNYSLL